MTYKKGDVVLVPFPFTDGKGSKKRPALVLSKEGHHTTYDKYVCLMITSQGASEGTERYEHNINSPLSRGLVLEPSFVIVDKVFTTEDRFILKKLGEIGYVNLRIVEPMFDNIYK
ncbi:type II toxin-antitoxin system PemK/MazF family toxin [Mesobacillus maritimus]|uniref:type II toxin-antitoxin system PemK/MazF family toxin n=1 Tax=Mesobacillus maritimus TaxID=1643336 RepID=UPI00384B5ACA